ncbi:uncharacterized protein Triagg1_4540 [Trichoderma aggressivum f. europaeum]|uniref:CCHC-type domain-containing protein n=1 Tax=Trichoderma aggressivum f. europaeum TaxID=173218 RepID=A0AAE1M0B6_9HYPO|nr:hypothetical protein Triagg1_4540 [Trichoderma aggressivum f. europaeum]
MEEKSSSAPIELAEPLSSLVPSNAMATDQSNPGDFISLSSDDEPPLAKKRKSPENDISNIAGLDAPAERSKRARVSSASASSTGAKVSEEGEIDEDEGSEGEIRTPSTGGDGKKSRGFASSGAFVPKSPPVYTSDSISLQLPVFSQQREGTWLARFEEWAQLLCTANATSFAKLTPKVIQDAYKQYIDTHSRLKANKKRAARQAAEQYKDTSLADLIKSLQPRQSNVAQLPAVLPEALGELKTQSDASSQLPARAQVSHKSENLDPAVPLPPKSLTTQTDGYFVIDVKPQPLQTANSREPRPMSQLAPQPAAKTAMSQRPGLLSGEDALEQQRRYFPSASDPSNMCLLCGREGHTADGCTNCACKRCGQDDHWQYACPSLDLKCDKCDIRGHSAAGCATVREERGYVFKCSLCHSTAHTDERCTQPWRSFHPEAETIKTVTALPVSCASCGSSQHFSANCITDRVAMDPTFPTNPTFSMYNMSRYIDAASTSFAIIGADELAPKQQPGDLKIPMTRMMCNSWANEPFPSLSGRVVLGYRPVFNRPTEINSLLCPLVHHLLIHLRRLPIAHQDTATRKHRLGQRRSLLGRQFHRGTTEAYRRLPPNLHKNLANSLDEEVEVVAEVVAEEAGEEAQEETEATEEENSEAAGVEAVELRIVVEFGDVQTRRGLWDVEWSKHALGDLIHSPLPSDLQCQRQGTLIPPCTMVSQFWSKDSTRNDGAGSLQPERLPNGGRRSDMEAMR